MSDQQRADTSDESCLPLRRHATRPLRLGNLTIGGEAPITLQTMTKCDTRDVAATLSQLRSVAALGCDIVRLAVPDMEAANALAAIRRGVPDLPLIADIHFDYRLALAAVNAGFDGLRLNPGNIGHVDQIRAVVAAARPRRLPIRIGVNGGSLEKEILAQYGSATPAALVASALRHVALLEAEEYYEIKISVKASDALRTVAAYRLLAAATPYPLHIGVTEAGTFLAGTVRSCAALGTLLYEGIGDTIRISLTDTPEQEVRVGQELLRALDLRPPGSSVTSCPTCGRVQVDVITTARTLEAELERYYQAHPAAARPHVAVMGCIVNGPGEAREADIALAGGAGKFILFKKGQQVGVVPESAALTAVMQLVREFK